MAGFTSKIAVGAVTGMTVLGVLTSLGPPAKEYDTEISRLHHQLEQLADVHDAHAERRREEIRDHIDTLNKEKNTPRLLRPKLPFLR